MRVDRKWYWLLAPVVWLLSWAVGYPFVEEARSHLPVWLPCGIVVAFAARRSVDGVLMMALVAFGAHHFIGLPLQQAATEGALVLAVGIPAWALLSLWGSPGSSPWGRKDWFGLVGLGIVVPTAIGAGSLAAYAVATGDLPPALAFSSALARWASHATGALLLAPLALAALIIAERPSTLHASSGAEFLAFGIGLFAVCCLLILPASSMASAVFALGALPVVAFMTRRSPLVIRAAGFAVLATTAVLTDALLSLPVLPLGGELLPLPIWIWVWSGALLVFGFPEPTAIDKAEEAHSARTLWQVLDQFADAAVITTNENDQIVFWNRRASDLYGISINDAIGNPLDQLVPRISTGDHESNGSADHLTVHDTSGREVPIYSFASDLIDGPNGPERYRFEFDMSAMQEAEAERGVETSRSASARALDAQAKMASAVATEIHTLIQSIVGHTDLAALELPETHVAQSRLQDVMHTCQRAEAICRQLLAFSGRPPRRTKLSDVSALINASVPSLQRSLRSNIELQVTLATDLPQVRIDRNQIREMIGQLVLAAGDSSLSGGELHIVTSQASLTKHDLASWTLGPHMRPGPFVVVEVQRPGDLGREPRGLIDTTAPISDFGLETAAALGIARGHGGDVQLFEEAAAGTIIRAWLPPANHALH